MGHELPRPPVVLKRFEILEGNPNIDLPPCPRKLEGEDQSICRNGNQVGMKFVGLQPSSFRELLNTHLWNSWGTQLRSLSKLAQAALKRHNSWPPLTRKQSQETSVQANWPRGNRGYKRLHSSDLSTQHLFTLNMGLLTLPYSQSLSGYCGLWNSAQATSHWRGPIINQGRTISACKVVL